jgi:hypothetical protein
MLMPTKAAISAVSVLPPARSGASSLQGPHHETQTLITMTFPALSAVDTAPFPLNAGPDAIGASLRLAGGTRVTDLPPMKPGSSADPSSLVPVLVTVSVSWNVHPVKARQTMTRAQRADVPGSTAPTHAATLGSWWLRMMTCA